MRVIDSIDELRVLTKLYSSGFLFRGQTKHYVGQGDKTSITTSFSRTGCIPPMMQKWILYCEEILYTLKGPNYHEPIALEECQALLQHYGWRSFYLDFTTSLEVACWFACNAYTEVHSRPIVEDCHEIGLMACFRSSGYSDYEGDGYVYIIDESKLSKHSIGVHNIEQFRFSDFDSRMVRQMALMVGPVRSLPQDVVVDAAKVSHGVLKEYSNRLKQDYLFPGRKEDLMYKLLLAAPFEVPRHVGRELGVFGPYVRTIDVPEYDYKFKKIIEPSVAFYQPQYFVKSTKFKNSILVQAPDSFLYHVEVSQPEQIDSVLYLLSDMKYLIVETDGILRFPSYHDKSIYFKGTVIERIDKDLICVSGLMINHPGTVCTGISVDPGWYYKVKSGKCVRMPSENDCPCNNWRKHMLELSVIHKLQYALVNNLVKLDGGIYCVAEE